MRDKRDKHRIDALIARIAAGQHGVVSLVQLRSTGLSSSAISRRVSSARLHRIHRGVYAAGHPRLSERGRWLAAVLACGAGAVLSHLSAAALWGIRRAAGGSVHVTVPRTSGVRQRDSIVVHRSSSLNAGHCTLREAIPVTTPSRTVADLRPLLSQMQFGAVLREAEFLGLLIEHEFESDGSRSELEQEMLALCRRHRLPQPEVNVRIDRFVVDFLWPPERLVVEVDGWYSHRSRSAFEEDRARDARLKLLGYEVVRFTWRQVTRERAKVARTIRTLLTARAA